MSVLSAPSQPDCRPFRIRTLAHAEDAPLHRVFAGLSERSRFLRYHRAAPALSSSMIAALIDIRPGQHVAHAAEVGGEPVGIVRWIRYPGRPAHAEIAAEVVDVAQGCGVGRRLAGASARSALEAGVQWFVMSVHPDNGVLRQWLRSVDAQRGTDDPEEFRVPVGTLLIDHQPNEIPWS